MDFAFSEQHGAVRDTVRRLCQTEHQSLVVAAEENESLPRIVRDELSYMSQGSGSSWSAHSHLGIWPIWKAGTDEQR